MFIIMAMAARIYITVYRRFWDVTLPVVRSGVIALAILVVVMSWNEYLLALFLAGSDAQPLTMGIMRFPAGRSPGPSTASSRRTPSWWSLRSSCSRWRQTATS